MKVIQGAAQFAYILMIGWGGSLFLCKNDPYSPLFMWPNSLISATE